MIAILYILMFYQTPVDHVPHVGVPQESTQPLDKHYFTDSQHENNNPFKLYSNNTNNWTNVC